MRHFRPHPRSRPIDYGGRANFAACRPACAETCGEEYVEEAEAARLLGAAEEAARAGVEIDVRDYVAA